jgi:KaiC/GvpD/RAD55 family RecA-like ATPase
VSLEQVAGRRVFASVTDPAHLAERYVSSEKLGAALGPDRPEAIMHNACVAGDRPARLHVEGGPGAGKTSLILTVIGQLARRQLERPVHPLIVNTGASRDVLRDQSSFLAFVIDLIAAQQHVFASLDPAMLAKASAEVVMSTPGAITHAFGIDAKVASYQATFTPAVETLISTRNRATIEQAFRAIIEAVAREYQYRQLDLIVAIQPRFRDLPAVT